MCGICGIFHLNQPAPIPRTILQTMTSAIAHRGPDSDGFHVDDERGIGLGFRRLAIIDLNTGDQPIYSEDRQTVTVFNGEIYNYQTLRNTLQAKGHRFTTQTDTEVLVHGYESWGIEGLTERLRGMYAFAIWDEAERRLHLVRDRMGQKPLYYAQYDQVFLFASEIKALLAHPAANAHRAINHDVLPEYLALGYVLPPNTLFDRIFKLGAGEYLTIYQDGQLKKTAYWHPTMTADNPAARPQQTENLRAMLHEAVAMRLMSDVPLGTFLSGGVDSTTITALTRDLTRQTVNSFTVGFDYAQASLGDQKFNVDLHHAQAAAESLACNHRAIIMPHDETLAELLPQLIYALDEPIADTAIMQTAFITALARYHNVPVLLSGDGADELFAGYNFFRAAHRVGQYQKWVPSVLRQNLLNPIIKQLPASGRFNALHKLNQKSQLHTDAEHFLSWDAQNDPASIPHLLLSPSSAPLQATYDRINQQLAHLPPTDLANRVGYARLRFWLSEISNMRSDKIAMWMSIEARAPFEDHELVDFSLGIPLQHKLPNGGKAILKDAVHDLLPTSVLNRPKWGFHPPMSDWLREPLRPLIEQYMSVDALRRNGLNPNTIRQMIDDHMTRRGYYLNELWNILLFQLWTAIYIHQTLSLPTRWTPQKVYELNLASNRQSNNPTQMAERHFS